MIDYIRGILSEKEVTHATVEAQGVGYGISIPLSTYERLGAPGTEVKLHTHLNVREDAHKLYGFFTKLEREIFRQLISVSGIGPKVALNILSGISVEELVRCVNTSDSSRLEKIPGIGGKTAQRLLIELHGKLHYASDAGPAAVKMARGVQAKVSARDEAFAALISLGYNDKQVVRAIQRVGEAIVPEAPVEEWIRKALQVI
jgi:holliday junction DNA helicase RuvA